VSKAVYLFRFRCPTVFGLDVDGVPCHHPGGDGESVHEVYTEALVARETVDAVRSLGGAASYEVIPPGAPYRKGHASEKREFEAAVRQRGEEGKRIRRIFDEEVDVRQDEAEKGKIV